MAMRFDDDIPAFDEGADDLQFGGSHDPPDLGKGLGLDAASMHFDGRYAPRAPCTVFLAQPLAVCTWHRARCCGHPLLWPSTSPTAPPPLHAQH